MNEDINKVDNLIIGVISDTHGLLRPEAVQALQGVNMIIHAGDIGKESVLDDLKSIAPVVAVRGNMDSGGWAFKLQRTEVLSIKNILIYVIHDLDRLDIDPEAADCNVIISGHSHRPVLQKHKGVLYLNPGSAGPRRFRLPVSVAKLHFQGKSVDAEIVDLKS